MPAARNRVVLLGTVVGQAQTWKAGGEVYLRVVVALGSSCRIKVVAKGAVATTCGTLHDNDRVDVEGRLDGTIVTGPGRRDVAVARVIAQRLDNLGPASPITVVE